MCYRSLINVGFVTCLLRFSLCAPAETRTRTFECGQDICKKKGYDICITPPLVPEDTDSYCMPCEAYESSCGTIDEQVGCNLYCQDLITNVLDLRIKKLEAENAKLHKENCGDAFNGRLWFAAFLSVTGLFIPSTVTYCVCRRIRQNRRGKGNRNIDTVSSSSDCSDSTPLSDCTADGEKEKEEENKDNTSQMCYGAKKLRMVNPTQNEDGKIAV